FEKILSAAHCHALAPYPGPQRCGRGSAAPYQECPFGRTLKPSAALKDPDNVANVLGQRKHAKVVTKVVETTDQHKNKKQKTIVEPALVIEPNARPLPSLLISVVLKWLRIRNLVALLVLKARLHWGLQPYKIR
ncbi:hypothetical protein JB92DRAFT_3139691, partial [Gautieria morchelliformis]